MIGKGELKDPQLLLSVDGKGFCEILNSKSQNAHVRTPHTPSVFMLRSLVVQVEAEPEPEPSSSILSSSEVLEGHLEAL